MDPDSFFPAALSYDDNHDYPHIPPIPLKLTLYFQMLCWFKSDKEGLVYLQKKKIKIIEGHV